MVTAPCVAGAQGRGRLSADIGNTISAPSAFVNGAWTACPVHALGLARPRRQGERQVAVALAVDQPQDDARSTLVRTSAGRLWLSVLLVNARVY
jgi:hypothetical protein